MQHESHGIDVQGHPQRDETLQHPNCVFQILKRHFSRYTPEMVARTCGVSEEAFLEVCEAWAQNSGREKTTALVYSVGWTQHSVGVQYIRTGAILQLLLGNMGRPGGGIMALRGHASIQGPPTSRRCSTSSRATCRCPTRPTTRPAAVGGQHPAPGLQGFWTNADAFAVSLLKAYWGDAATAENDYCFDYLPKLTGDHGTYRTVLDMIDGKVKGYFLLGQNPPWARPTARRSGSAWPTSTGSSSGTCTRSRAPPSGRTRPRSRPARSCPRSAAPRCSCCRRPRTWRRTFTQTQRMVQWREKALEPVGDCRSELWFFYHLGRMVKERLAGSTDPKDRPVLDLGWDYPVEGEFDDPSGGRAPGDQRVTAIVTRRPLSTFFELKNDGSTVGGCWIYTGVFADGVNQAARRKPGREQSWVAPEWGWVWPLNRRILYNRASADPDGKPWSEKKAYVWWDEEAGEWTGHDVPDFEKKKPPSYRPPRAATASRRSPATTRSSCRPTARTTSTSPRA